MKTIKQVIRENPDKARIIKATIRAIGKESIEDVINHGADSGFSGFIYYSDTCKFYKKFRKEINNWIEEIYQDLGYKSSIEMVKSFGCLKDETEKNIGICLYSGKLNDDTTQVENGLAWFALEEVCRLFEAN